MIIMFMHALTANVLCYVYRCIPHPNVLSLLGPIVTNSGVTIVTNLVEGPDLICTHNVSSVTMTCIPILFAGFQCQ